MLLQAQDLSPSLDLQKHKLPSLLLHRNGSGERWLGCSKALGTVASTNPQVPVLSFPPPQDPFRAWIGQHLIPCAVLPSQTQPRAAGCDNKFAWGGFLCSKQHLIYGTNKWSVYFPRLQSIQSMLKAKRQLHFIVLV